MSSAWRQLRIITTHEVVDSVRSRRAMTLMILYLAGSIASCWLFVNVLHRIENRLTQSMSLQTNRDPGQVASTLWQSEHFRQIMGQLVGDRALADRLLKIPPLSIFYGWLVFTFAPFLIVLVSSPRIAEEVNTSSVRFVLFRVSRGAWCAGKFAGQAILLLAAFGMSGFAAWMVGVLFMQGFPLTESAWWMAVFSLKGWIFGIPYLGLALGVSQWSRSPVIATGMGLLALIGMGILHHILNHYGAHGSNHWIELASLLLPSAHRLGLWRLDLPHVVTAVTMLIALGVLYFSLGYLRFAVKDQ